MQPCKPANKTALSPPERISGAVAGSLGGTDNSRDSVIYLTESARLEFWQVRGRFKSILETGETLVDTRHWPERL